MYDVREVDTQKVSRPPVVGNDSLLVSMAADWCCGETRPQRSTSLQKFRELPEELQVGDQPDIPVCKFKFWLEKVL